MPLKQNVSSTWKDLTGWVNVSGTWKKAAIWQNVSGTWKKITSLISASLPGSMYSTDLVFSGTATGEVRLLSSGAWDERNGSSGTWIDGVNPASAYECYFTVSSGTLSYGTAGTWLSLATTRSWGVQQSSIGYKSVTGTLQIREASSGTVLASCGVTLEATYEI
jgi:hypothetical protein